jgi:hypothetical protein
MCAGALRVTARHFGVLRAFAKPNEPHDPMLRDDEGPRPRLQKLRKWGLLFVSLASIDREAHSWISQLRTLIA